MIGRAPFGRGQSFVDLGPAQADILGAVQRQRLGRGAVAPGAADLLVIGLDRFRQVGVGDPADVGLVHAHPEGDRGADDQPVLGGEAFLDRAAIVGFHPAVVMRDRMPILAQRPRKALGLGAGAAIDDARLAAARLGEGHDLLARAVLGLERQVDVRSVETAQEGLRPLAPEQAGDDFLLRLGVGGRGEGRKRHAQRAAQFADAQVIGPEIVAPLADAMRLVHGDQRHARLCQHPLRPARGQPFRREVEQLERAVVQRAEHGVGLFLGIARGQRTGGDAGLAQPADLVAHQRDERRNHHRHAGAHQRRKLEAQRLAPACGHDRQHVAPLGHGLDDLALAGAERIEAENVFQHRLGGRDIAGHGACFYHI